MKLLIINLVLGLYFLPLTITYVSARYYYANKRWVGKPGLGTILLILMPVANIFGSFYHGPTAFIMYLDAQTSKRIEQNLPTIGERFLRIGGQKK